MSGSNQASSPVERPANVHYDKQQMHGSYYHDADHRVAAQNKRRDWREQLSKQAAFKALDEPMLDEDEDMHIDARRRTTVNGIGGWPLALLALLSMPLAGLAGVGFLQLTGQLPKPATTPPPATAPVDPPQQQDPPEPPPTAHHDHRDTDTRIRPRIGFGPDRNTP